MQNFKFFYSATVRVTEFTDAPKNPEGTLQTMFLGSENSFASVFWRSLGFSVPRCAANNDFRENLAKHIKNVIF